MVSIKDFKVGQTAYIISLRDKGESVPVKVEKVGRKYVTVSYKTTYGTVYKKFKSTDHHCAEVNFFIDTEYGLTKLASEQEIMYREEKNKYINLLSYKTIWWGSYSLEQLKTVAEILGIE